MRQPWRRNDRASNLTSASSQRDVQSRSRPCRSRGGLSSGRAPALARLAVDTLCGDRPIIVLRNHGYVAVGSSLAAATDRIIAMHERRLQRGS